jgi:hypothetical protein
MRTAAQCLPSSVPSFAAALATVPFASLARQPSGSGSSPLDAAVTQIVASFPTVATSFTLFLFVRFTHACPSLSIVCSISQVAEHPSSGSVFAVVAFLAPGLVAVRRRPACRW